MSDLTTLEGVEAGPLSEAQIRGILAQIDLDIVNLARDGKLAAVKYAVPGAAGRSMDRAVGLKMLLDARKHYERLLTELPAMEVSRVSSE